MLRAVVVWLNLQVMLLLSRANHAASTPITAPHSTSIQTGTTTIYVSHPIPVAAPYPTTSSTATATPSPTTYRATFFCRVFWGITSLLWNINTINSCVLGRSSSRTPTAILHHSCVSTQLPLKGTNSICWGGITIRWRKKATTAYAWSL